MEWRDPPGRLNEVRRLTQAEMDARAADLAANGPMVCMSCGFQGFSEREDAPEGASRFTYHGCHQWNEATQRYDIPSQYGHCTYECPRCHYVSNERGGHGTGRGILHLVGWWPKKGEWYPVVCEDSGCLNKGQTYIALGCPGCGGLVYWHHASNHEPHNSHAWSVHISEDGLVLTMSPSLFESPPIGCHFFIRGNKVEWCG